MTIYTVNAPPAPAGDPPPDPARLVFVKDGFSWPALFIPEIWLIARRMWLVLVLYVAAGVVLVMLAERLGGGLGMSVLLLARFLFALEANGLRRWTLERNGYTLAGVVEARGLEEAERRFFIDWTGDAAPSAIAGGPASAATAASPPAAPAPPAPVRAEPWKPTPENGGVVGLFPSAGGSAT